MTLDPQPDVLAWHFVNNEGTLAHDLDHITVVPGLFVACDPDAIELCAQGFHASLKALDALSYAPGNIVCRVRMGGRIEYAEDKLVASERTVLWTADATRVLQTFAIECAEEALYEVETRGYTADPRSWAALETAKHYLAGGSTTKKQMRDAADAAARAAARAAPAAYAAARAAVHAARTAHAAAYAVHAAARAAAYAAARAAAGAKQEQRLTARLLALEPAQ